MIDLRLRISELPILQPLVLRLRDRVAEHENDAVLIERDGDRREYDFNGFSAVIHASAETDLEGDVILALPGKGVAHRLIRASSQHNTLLVTEQCDQLCVMCSQPPKKYHNDLYDEFALAIDLAPENARIGISGGEPLLHKERLFELLLTSVERRPDIRFHVLTNGQHFADEDFEQIRAQAELAGLIGSGRLCHNEAAIYPDLGAHAAGKHRIRPDELGRQFPGHLR